MAINLQIDNALGATAQPVKDQNGNASQLFLTAKAIGVGASGESGVSIFQVPGPRRAHLQLGDPTATAGVASAKLSFAGFGIEHAGFVWVPDGQLSKGKLHLTFGGSDDPTPRGKQPARVTFQANGNVGIGTDTPQDKLVVEGTIRVSGDVRLTGADCAENFDVDDFAAIEPGMVMVIADEERLQPCRRAYDRRVAGVLSGAGDYRPGIVLGTGTEAIPRKQCPLALVGKVYCLVDAGYSSISIGDMLTTSPTPGHAMKVSDPGLSFGSVIGKALRPLLSGTGLVPVLVALQ